MPTTMDAFEADGRTGVLPRPGRSILALAAATAAVALGSSCAVFTASFLVSFAVLRIAGNAGRFWAWEQGAPEHVEAKGGLSSCQDSMGRPCESIRVIRLDSPMAFHALETLVRELGVGTLSPRGVVLDLSGLHSVDVVEVMELEAFARSCASGGKAALIEGCSPSVRKVLGHSGVLRPLLRGCRFAPEASALLARSGTIMRQ